MKQAHNLTDPEIAALLAEHPGWRLEGKVLVRDLIFKDFAEAIAFINRVAPLAEQANHHPDLLIQYNKVRLELTSHDVGALTHRDAAMVRQLSNL